MAETLPVVLIPGLNCSPRLYAEQIPALWRFGPVQVADHTRDDSMDAIATRVLAAAPPRFGARRTLDGRLPRLDHRAARARAGAKARAARHLGATRNAGADRAAQAADRARRGWQIRRGVGASVSGIPPSQPARRRSAARARAPHGRGDRSAGVLAPAASDHEASGYTAVLACDRVSDPGARRRRR